MNINSVKLAWEQKHYDKALCLLRDLLAVELEAIGLISSSSDKREWSDVVNCDKGVAMAMAEEQNTTDGRSQLLELDEIKPIAELEGEDLVIEAWKQLLHRGEIAFWFNLFEYAINTFPLTPHFIQNIYDTVENYALPFFKNDFKLLGKLAFCYQLFNPVKAIFYYKQAIELNPSYEALWINSLHCYRLIGDTSSIYEILKARYIENSFEEHSHGGHLIHAQTVPQFSSEEVLQLHRKYASVLEKRIIPVTPKFPKKKQTLRIGYVSPDYRNHPVAFFLYPILSKQGGRIENYCYYSYSKEDTVTQNLREQTQGWRSIYGISDEDASKLILQDEIDILVDLGGYTSNSRPELFAYKPAPIQISYCGYPDTTGLSRIDYRIVDAYTDPLDAPFYASENPLRMPHCFLCFAHPSPSPDLISAPYMRNGFITFACFNNITKINERVIEAWSHILNRVPNSRLLLKSPNFQYPEVLQKFQKAFENFGIAQERVKYITTWFTNRFDQLKLYELADISLDPFPYNGTTTTCESLWMGVPVITLVGDRHVARVGYSLLSQIQFHEGIAFSPEEYVEKAVRLADNPSKIQNLRSSLRTRVSFSPLCDAITFTRDLEAIYERVWKISQLEKVAESYRNANDKVNEIRIYREILELDSNSYTALDNLGTALGLQGNTSEAIAILEMLVMKFPHKLNTLQNLTRLCFQTKDISKTLHYALQGQRLFPKETLFHYFIGLIHQERNDYPTAITAFKSALECDPSNTVIHIELGKSLVQERKYLQAEEYFKYVTSLHPHDDALLGLLGETQFFSAKYEEAICTFHQILARSPTCSFALKRIAYSYMFMGKLFEAIRFFEKDVECFSGEEDLRTLNNLTGLYFHTAQYKKSFDLGESLLSRETASPYLFYTNYRIDIRPEQIFSKHQEWGRCIEQKITPLTLKKKALNKVLKIGYVSSDLRQHSVAYFLLPILIARSERVENFCYAHVEQPDTVSEALKQASQGWRNIHPLSDSAACEQIMQDDIDILVDLSGHTGNSRLRIFAHKPAPIQATYLGYPNTTGLSRMDYRIVDAFTDPLNTSSLFTEKLVQLPNSFICYASANPCPPLSAVPSTQQNVLTLGSLNALVKINDAVITLWSEILNLLPTAKLVLKSKDFNDERIKYRTEEQFEQHNISRNRLLLYPFQKSNVDHLSLYNTIDIALDPFPYNGTTTTCEALWMGVPVITLVGDQHAGRVGYSILSQLKLTECIAFTKDEYVEKTIALAQDPKRLIFLRKYLRPTMVKSPLCNAKDFTASLENAYHGMRDCRLLV